jgi:hypothetical protein
MLINTERFRDTAPAQDPVDSPCGLHPALGEGQGCMGNPRPMEGMKNNRRGPVGRQIASREKAHGVVSTLTAAEFNNARCRNSTSCASQVV